MSIYITALAAVALLAYLVGKWSVKREHERNMLEFLSDPDRGWPPVPAPPPPPDPPVFLDHRGFPPIPK